MSARAWILAPALLAAAAAPAGTVGLTLLGAGQVSQPWLTLDDDPRASAMGGATAGLDAGTAALQANPSGLDSLVDPELSLSDNELDSTLGMRLEDLAYGQRLGPGAAAVSLRYYSLGSFEDRDAAGNLVGSSNDSAYALGLAYAQASWADRLHLGLDLAASQELVAGETSTLFTAGAGATLAPGWGLRLAAALQGFTLGGEGTAPTVLRAGLAWKGYNPRLGFSAEWDHPLYGDGSLRVGGEWVLGGNYALRAGWRFNQGEGGAQDSGFSAGAGATFGDLRLDYAFVPLGVFGGSQRLGLTLSLGALLRSDVVIEAPGSEAAAAAEYRDGMDAFRRGDWYAAKESFKSVLRLQPDADHASDIKGLLMKLDAKIAADKAKGDMGAGRAFVAKKLDEARVLFKAGQLVEARKKLQEIFDWDPSLHDAVALQQQLETTIQTQVAVLKHQAADALSSGDLFTAVSRYRSILRLYDADSDARGNLEKLRPRIAAQARALHLQGVDRYVNGDLKKAVELWQQALALDPSDSNGVRRDLDKAQQLLGVQK